MFAKVTTNKKLVRGIVPEGTTHLTCYVDVQKDVLFYVVLATQTDNKNEIIGAHVAEYGAYPDQKRAYYTLSDVKRGKFSLSKMYPNLGEEDRIVRSLQDLTDGLCEKRWAMEDGGDLMPLSRVIVDSSNWTNIIKKTLRNSKYSAILLAAKGWGNDKNFSTAMDDWPIKPGIRRGSNWRLDVPDRHILIGTNNWKTFVAARISTAQGLRGSLTFHQATEAQHKMFFDHIAAEWGQPRDCSGRIVTIWTARPNLDNHLWDCLVGSFVAASEQGALGVGHAPEKKKKKRPVPAVEVTW
jgi:phage terminase large subunit GpA-like protein